MVQAYQSKNSSQILTEEEDVHHTTALSSSSPSSSLKSDDSTQNSSTLTSTQRQFSQTTTTAFKSAFQMRPDTQMMQQRPETSCQMQSDNNCFNNQPTLQPRPKQRYNVQYIERQQELLKILENLNHSFCTQILACVPIRMRINPYDTQDQYLLVTQTDEFEHKNSVDSFQLQQKPRYKISFFSNFEELQSIDQQFDKEDFVISSVNFKTLGGLALWHPLHMSTEPLWKLKPNGEFRKYLTLSEKSSFFVQKQYQQSDSDNNNANRIVYNTSDSFDSFNRVFQRLKQGHSIVGIWVDVTSSSGDKYKVHSTWIKQMGVGFFCYYNMTVQKFIERLHDLSKNGGYQLQDLSVYLNPWGKLQVAAVWLAKSTTKFKVDAPIDPDPVTSWIYNQLMVPYQIPGVQLVLYKHGRSVLDMAFGYSNVHQQIPAQNDRLHRLASISKVVTRLAIEKLIRKKKRRIKYNSYVFPDVFEGAFSTKMNTKADWITVQHLLDHKTGLWPTKTREEDPMFKYPNLKQNLLIQAVLNECRIENDPGGEYVYSNFGYCILGRIIEHLTGLSYVEFVQQNISPSFFIAGNSQGQLRNQENYYYAENQDAFTMPLSRMDSCAGLITTPRALALACLESEQDEIEQRGSLDGCENLIVKRNGYCMAVFCNKRHSYDHKLPLLDLFDFLTKTH